jgi:CheY-like chemotaxis protein
MSFSLTTSQQPFTILLVDDDDGDARAVTRAFSKAKIGNQMVRAVDGIDALDILKGENGKTKPAQPVIMLVDLNMPRMNGIQFVQALRSCSRFRHSIVFILSTSMRDEDKTAAYDLNVAGYIAKATAGADFLISLVTLIDSYGCLVELP